MIPNDDDLNEQRRVRAKWGGDGRTHIEGRLVAYSVGPMVLVEDDDGNREWWSAALTDRVTDKDQP